METELVKRYTELTKGLQKLIISLDNEP